MKRYVLILIVSAVMLSILSSPVVEHRYNIQHTRLTVCDSRGFSMKIEEVEISPPTLKSELGFSDTDVRDFAALVYLEAGGESYECQKAVASVVLNRMQKNGTSFQTELYKPGQFTPASSVPYTTPSQSCIDAVEDVLTNGTTLPSNVIYFRANYYFDWCTPYTSIGQVYFSCGG